MNKKALSPTDKKSKNENLALITGFVLIILVSIFTLFRNNIFPKKNITQSGQTSEVAAKIASSKYETISANDLNKKNLIAKQKSGFVLLDVRQSEFYIEEHIVDSINIAPDEFPASSKIDVRGTIIIIGENNDDKNIIEAINKLKEEKIENIKVLAGGMESWRKLIGATVSYGDPKSFIDQSKVAYLDPEALNDALQQKVPVFIVDVRTPEEYATGHIPGAKNVQFDELEKRRSEITERRIIVVGASELQEFQASVQLYDMLLVSPFVMRGAMPTWKSKSFSIVTN